MCQYGNLFRQFSFMHALNITPETIKNEYIALNNKSKGLVFSCLYSCLHEHTFLFYVFLGIIEYHTGIGAN